MRWTGLLSLSGILWLLIATAHAEDTMFIPQPGLYEGIDDDGYFQVLEIKPDAPHRLVLSNTYQAFRHGLVVEFVADEMSCSASECIFDTRNPQFPQERIRLLIAPSLDLNLKVLRLHIDSSGKNLLSYGATLYRQTGKSSTVRRFIEQNRDRLQALPTSYSNELEGFWVGLLQIDNRQDLVKLELNLNGRSRFVRYISGSTLTHETEFEPAQIRVDGVTIRIQTSHPTFANQLFIVSSGADWLEGFMFSEHQGQTLQRGSFRLLRQLHKNANRDKP